MADDVPVSEVLCEAMEYLCKLGSNLRSRSESLKQKRMSKDKLKNYHAIQKAANKVLLICELSKKSLDNVETGVRKVLSAADASQRTSSSGVRTSTDKKFTDSKNRTSIDSPRSKSYHTFEFQSRKLKIAKKISVKHFTSVKVLAKRISMSMLENYPVYYDCKLYRMRKRQARKEKLVFEDSDAQIDLKEASDENSKSKEKSQSEVEESANKVKREKDEVTAKKSNTSTDVNEKKKSSSVSSEQQSKVHSHTEVKKSSKSHTEEHKHSQHQKGENEKSKNKNKLFDKSHAEKHAAEEKSKKDVEKLQTSNLDTESHSDSKSKKKKFKHVMVIDDSSEDEAKKVSDAESEKKTGTDKPSSPQELDTKKKNNSDVESEENQRDEHTKEVSPSEELESNTSKTSIIKCVSLSKLLKPAVLQKVSLNTLEADKTASKTSKQKRNESKDQSSKKHISKKVKFEDEEEAFWQEKRKEVKNFKPKEFSVNLLTLPEITTDFLQLHKLRLVTQGNTVICAIGNEKTRTKQISHSESVLEQEVINEVKNALLNDSESDLENEVNSEKNSQNKDINCKTNSQKVESSNGHRKSNPNRSVNSSDSESNVNVKVNKQKSCINQNEMDKCAKEKDKSSSAVSDNEKQQDATKPTNLAEKSAPKASDPETQNIKDSLLESSDSESNGEKNEKSKNKAECKKTENKQKENSNSENEDSGSKRKEKNQSKISSPNISKKSLEKEEKSGASSEDACRKEDKNKNHKSIVKEHAMEKSISSDRENADQNEENTSLVLESDSDEQTNVNDNKQNGSTSEKRNSSREASKEPEVSDSRRHQLEEEKDCSETVDEDKETSDKNTEKDNNGHEDCEALEGRTAVIEDEKEIAKSSLLKDSSGDSPKSMKKTKRSDSTPNSKRKLIMESMEAKKMLLTYSSSSENEDGIKSVMKDIKKLAKRIVSSDEEVDPNAVKEGPKNSGRETSSDSEIDASKRVTKKKKMKRKKTRTSSDSNSEKDECSNSSNKKMGRSSEKPGSSSSHSDNQDDKDIEGLTNLNSLNKSRRRPESNSKKTESSSKNDKKLKTKHISGEQGLLEAPSSSDEASAAESEALEEDLPAISLSGLNGSAMDHLAKEDLLGESDSDASKDKDISSDDIKKDDSDTDNVKSKRRKANAISSDSEAGSSKPKQGSRFSDFEDSEDESSEPAKKGKRKKKKASDSDASYGSSTEGGSKKKRRRIKQLDSDASGSEDEHGGKNKHGRKNIRKVMGKNQLEEATKKAAREEKERVARIAERQKMYNNLEFDESGKPDEVVLDKVVLDFDPETKEPLIEVDRGLVKKLKPHQANGIKFMWDACFESVKRIKKDKGSGCILAHCMGLGKTLQVVSLTHTLLTNSSLTGVNRVLVVCPLSTVLNWVNEFRMWLKHAETDYDVDVYELSRFKQNSERAFQLSQWFTHGGVCVLGYEMFRNLSADNNKKFKKKMLRQFQESLVDPGPELVVCDEGHLLKNEKTSLSQSMNRVKTRRRIVLTGTPLQNNLKEYYCMVQFVKPNLLGKYNEYLNRFVNPITNGQYTDSTEQDIRVMKRRSHVLHKMLDGAVQRRDYSVLAPFLPPKHEYVLFITLTEVQIKLYQFYLDNYSRRPLPGKSSGFLFPDFQSLQRIWTHPLVLKYNSERYEIMQQKKREREEEEDSEGSLADFIDDDSTPDESTTEESESDLSDASDDSRKKKKKKSPKKSKDRKVTTRRGTRANPIDSEPAAEADAEIVEVKNDNPTEWWIPLVTDDEIEDMRNSHKLVLLFEILRQCEAIGDKVLVFSQSLYSLDLIEHFLGKVDEATQEGRIDEKLGGHVGSWSPGIDYFRLDGSTSCENRSIWCKNFNREDNPRARLFLISTRAGGLGINLVAANRVVIFDVSWNPSHDVQSIFRVYRFGQKKPCYIYRFLAMGTMEEKIYERQVTKQAISKRVIDEQQIDRHYAENDLAELYKFEPRPPSPRPVPNVPKDRFFAEMLKDHEHVIYKFHEHDSLLENKEEETLSEEERKAAWEDFENEKNKPPPAPFPTWPMHNGMGAMPMLQQQQLMYAAVAAMLRKDMPNLTDDQIRNMLPLIYGANPGMFGGYDYGLMQKLNDMYKYAQPGMMNPGMMNPVMNSGPPVSSNPAGSSGLQYEPPWQRQQQQQQQMRLQQLLQHQQNAMGAKLYAGGLGSRDPVAMALQQQRAREMMLGERRPRGRPPLAAATARHMPSATDIVNLDSD